MSASPEPMIDSHHTAMIRRGMAPRHVLWLTIGLIFGVAGALLWTIHGTRVFVELVDTALAWCM